MSLFKMLDKMTAINSIESAEFDLCLGMIQDLLGVTDGGFASVHFTGYDSQWAHWNKSERMKFLTGYINGEFDQEDPELELKQYTVSVEVKEWNQYHVEVRATSEAHAVQLVKDNSIMGGTKWDKTDDGSGFGEYDLQGAGMSLIDSSTQCIEIAYVEPVIK